MKYSFKVFEGFPEVQCGGYRLDLPGIIRQQAVDLGIPQHHIELSSACTFCYGNGKTFFSYRRDKNEPPLTSLSYVVKRPLT